MQIKKMVCRERKWPVDGMSYVYSSLVPFSTDVELWYLVDLKQYALICHFPNNKKQDVHC
jgi:hypothetical protein